MKIFTRNKRAGVAPLIDPNEPLPSAPEHKFHPDDADWQSYCYFLARDYDMTMTAIAALCHVPFFTFRDYLQVTGVISQGRAEFRNRVMNELNSFIVSNPELFDDPIERATIRKLKLDAIKHWTKMDESRAEREELKQELKLSRDALSSLSSDELKAKAEQLLRV